MRQTSENTLEDSFFRAWKPLFFLQTTIGSAKVNVVNNIMTTRAWYQKAYGCVNLVLCSIGMFYLTSRSAFFKMENEWNLQSFLIYTHVTVALLLNGCPIIVNNFFNTNANLKLIISLQRIDQTLRITTNERHYQHIYRFTLGFVLFILVSHIVMDIYIVVQNIGYRDLYIAIPTIVILTSQDFEVVFFDGALIFLILRVRYINSLLSRTADVKWKSLKQLETPRIVHKILEAYRHILEVYELLQKTSAPFLLLLCLHMFSNELISLEGLIAIGMEMSVLSLFQCALLASKVYIRILFIGMLTTWLQQQILRTRLACLRVINETTNQETRRHVKNLLRLVTSTRPMTAFGVVALSSLPLKMAAVTTTYAVVLLQLNFQATTKSKD